MANLKTGELVMTFGDAHVYENHILNVEIQLKRVPFSLPKLKMLEPIYTFDDLSLDKFKLVDYKYYPKLKYEMAM
ncbi:Thymidylate synthase [Anthophora plagiata]